LPSLIIVGIYGRLELRFSSQSVLQVSYFPGLKALCQAGKLPDFRVAVSTPLSPDEDGTAYQLYQEFCRFLLLELKAMSSRSDNPIADLIFLSARKRYSTNEAFDSTIVRAIVKSYDKIHKRKGRTLKPEKVHSAEKVQKWFEEIAEKRLINLNSPLPTKFFEERFKRFRKFSYNYTTKDKRTRQLTRDISRLDEIFDDYGMSLEFREMMRKKFNEIGELSRVCQPLSRDSIEEIRKLLNQFNKISSVTIRVKLKKILAKLKLSLARQQKIEDYLRKIEYTTVEPGKLYRNELIEDKRLKAKFCPAINKYLDKVEKSFMKE
ncbi:MAG: hypothetical protein KOO69_07410, partial [Victivallales bacterium]|nr:hypothetical protein [Victivallales bacterium]